MPMKWLYCHTQRCNGREMLPPRAPGPAQIAKVPRNANVAHCAEIGQTHSFFTSFSQVLIPTTMIPQKLTRPLASARFLYYRYVILVQR